MMYMNIIFPVTTFFIAFKFPAILGLYWIYQSIFGAISQIILSKIYPIPQFTEEEYAAIEEEMNRDYVAPVIKPTKSLHYIDEDYDGEADDNKENDKQTELIEAPKTVNKNVRSETSNMPPRRRYDKNGNKIRSLHFIDDEDDEDISVSDNNNGSIADTTTETDSIDKNKNTNGTDNTSDNGSTNKADDTDK
jgi:membrane protein insertase Oxa1/YidC/SpoIIIJ